MYWNFQKSDITTSKVSEVLTLEFITYEKLWNIRISEILKYHNSHALEFWELWYQKFSHIRNSDMSKIPVEIPMYWNCIGISDILEFWKLWYIRNSYVSEYVTEILTSEFQKFYLLHFPKKLKHIRILEIPCYWTLEIPTYQNFWHQIL